MAHRPKIDNSITGVRSNQNLSCNWTGSADFGRLVPIHWEELLPTDKVITCRPRIEMQMLPLASPTFGKIDLYVHYFVVPLRQLQDNFYDIWSQSGVYRNSPFPWLSPKSFQRMYGSGAPYQQRALYKHWTSLGLNPFFALGSSQPVTDDSTPISLFPFRAYNKIWWDFYRDPELIRDISKSHYLKTSDVNDNADLSDSYRYMYPHVRSIKNNWISDLFSTYGISPNNYDPDYVFADNAFLQDLATGEAEKTISETNVPLGNTELGDEVRALQQQAQFNRVVESLTRLSERLSLSGKREIEALFARYGVKPKWSEMNLCRYVGGAKSTVLVSDITATADTYDGSSGSPLGRKAGAGYCALNDLNIEVEVDEPSILMGIMSIMPHIHYVQGLSKKWQRKTLTDMFQKSLEHVGQVAVAKREVAMYYDEAPGYLSSEDGATFAFSDPYYEYKMGLDVLAGDFMKYHNVEGENETLLYMQSMEQYIDFPLSRDFNADNLKVDGDAFNKIFFYLGGSVDEDVDDHFHICIDKEVVINRPMEGYAIPTLETTQNPHESKTRLSADKML